MNLSDVLLSLPAQFLMVMVGVYMAHLVLKAWLDYKAATHADPLEMYRLAREEALRVRGELDEMKGRFEDEIEVLQSRLKAAEEAQDKLEAELKESEEHYRERMRTYQEAAYQSQLEVIELRQRLAGQ